ncbi:MAG: LuxR C-terminal-related transcriptional regulator [Coriobacteriales bacterium]|nr:LuxR C-terminal-related transcriptional regulator [Coriobacteriales bacterium]
MTQHHTASGLALFISDSTAHSHTKNIYKKMGVGSRTEIIEIVEKHSNEAAPQDG